MRVQNLFEPYQIEYKEAGECPLELRKNTFFELIYILKGSGTHLVNGNTFDYDNGTLFLLLPQHQHAFKVRETTSFLFIRFNNIYLTGQQVSIGHSNLGDWISKLEFIFQSNYQLPGCILQNPSDKQLVWVLTEALVYEQLNHQDFRKEVTQQLVNTLITVVARNIRLINSRSLPPENDLSRKIIGYIHERIYLPDELKTEVIAAYFHLSHNYIHEYFRKHTGESLQRYITRYKVGLIETRLRYSTMRIGEIVNELGFTDESHLNRVFRKYKGLSPTAFRKYENTVNEDQHGSSVI